MKNLSKMISVSAIEIGEKPREVVEYVVGEMEKSIEILGLLQPIGVTVHPTQPGKYVPFFCKVQ